MVVILPKEIQEKNLSNYQILIETNNIIKIIMIILYGLLS